MRAKGCAVQRGSAPFASISFEALLT